MHTRRKGLWLPWILQMLRLLVGLGGVFGLAVALATPAVARDKAKKHVDPNDDDDDDDNDDKDDEANYGPWTVKIPGLYHGRGYSLRIDGEEVPLDKDTVVLRGEDNRQRVELIDKAGRVQSDDTVYVDAYIFEFVSPRTWRLGLHAGGTAVNGTGMRKILQDSHLQESSFDVAWQPGPLGVLVSMANLNSEQTHSPGVTSTFDEAQLRVAAYLEEAPFRHSQGALQRLHVGGFLGVMSVGDKITIEDAEVTITDESSSLGAIGGVDLLYPFYKFWIDVRIYGSWHRMEFDDPFLDFKAQSVQRGALIGGAYAF